MPDVSAIDLRALERIEGFTHLGGRPLTGGFVTRGDQRLIDSGLAELRGERMYLTPAGAERLRSGEVNP
ncbi:hypothetical protein [Gaopeijia maritima]|uniref:hypothetical protein n=1 Tax=Gaopeijia maritima TaxID=3119007 RepID=UPI003289F074